MFSKCFFYCTYGTRWVRNRGRRAAASQSARYACDPCKYSYEQAGSETS